MSQYLGSTRNGVTGVGCDLEVVCNEAVLPREREPGIRSTHVGKRGHATVGGGPYRTVYITPPWDGFPSSTARQPRGCQYRTIRLRQKKALGDTFPKPTSLAPTLIRLWRYRPWTIDPGVCDILRRILVLPLITTSEGHFLVYKPPTQRHSEDTRYGFRRRVTTFWAETFPD